MPRSPERDTPMLVRSGQFTRYDTDLLRELVMLIYSVAIDDDRAFRARSSEAAHRLS